MKKPLLPAIQEIFEKLCNHHSISYFELIQPKPREDGFPKVKEIIPISTFVHLKKDPNFDLPLSNIKKEY